MNLPGLPLEIEIHVDHRLRGKTNPIDKFGNQILKHPIILHVDMRNAEKRIPTGFAKLVFQLVPLNRLQPLPAGPMKTTPLVMLTPVKFYEKFDLAQEKVKPELPKLLGGKFTIVILHIPISQFV
jgi:hypothetical protein